MEAGRIKKTGSRHKRGGAPPPRRPAPVSCPLKTHADWGDQPQLFLRDLLHLILGGALGDVRGQGGVFLLLGLDLGRQGVPLGLGVLHLAVEAAQLQSDRRQNHQDQKLGEDASSGPLLWRRPALAMPPASFVKPSAVLGVFIV